MPTALEAETEIDPHRDPGIEAWLDSYGVKWEYLGPIKIERIDVEKSLANQARVFEPIDEDTVTTYAEALKRGDQFPAIVGARTNGQARSRLTMIDGNHRQAAYARAGLAEIPAYAVTGARQTTVAMMTFTANTRHGKPTSHEERLHQAIWLINNGASQEEAAAAVQVKKSDVTKAWTRILADNRADEVGVLRREWDPISYSSKQRLNNILTDEGFRAAANLTFRANLDANQVFELVAEVNKVRSSDRQVAIVKKLEKVFSDQIQEAGAGIGTGGRRQVTPKATFRRAITSLSTLPENVDLIVNLFAEQERSEAAKQARDTAAQLTAIADRLEG